MKLIDKDALVAEIDKYLKKVEKRLERNNSYSEEGCSAWERDKALYDSYNRTLSFIDTLEVKEPTSEDLEKASEEYAYTNWESDDYHEGASEGKPFDAIGHTQKCFIDGAQWHKEKMMKDAIECHIDYYDGPILDFIQKQLDDALEKNGAKIGDKVKVIIIKE